MVIKNEERWIDEHYQEPSAPHTSVAPDHMLLIDADIMYHRAGFAVEEKFDFDGVTIHASDCEDGMHLFHRLLTGILKNLNTTRFVLCWSGNTNFRQSVDPGYKANRSGMRRPQGGTELKKALLRKYPSILVEGLEADDLMGLNSGVGTIIVSDDKDMMTVPGLHYRPRKPEEGIQLVNEADAMHRWYQQILMGDRVDGYAGIPGIGEKKSQKILNDGGLRWLTVLQAYLDNGLSEEDAIRTAQLARILQPGEWDFTLNKPILWRPDETLRIS